MVISVGPKRLSELKSAFGEYLEATYPDYALTTTSTWKSDAFYGLKHKVVSDFWGTLGSPTGLDELRNAIFEHLVTCHPRENPELDANGYRDSAEKLKTYLEA